MSRSKTTSNNWTLVIGRVPPSRNSAEARSRFQYAKLKSSWKDEVALICRELRIPELRRIRTEPRIFFPDSRRRDHDNYGIVNKLVHDGLVAARVIPDDSPEYLAKPSYPDLLVDRKNPRTEVVITALDEG
jgi:crossover junction endodeoxyribonuclease RusA